MPQPDNDSISQSIKLVTVQTPDGQDFLVEVRDMGGRNKVAGDKTFHAEDLIKSIRSISSSLVSALKEIGPEKFTVEFGVEATFEAGKLLALLCKGGATANLKVTLEWQKAVPQQSIPQHG